MLRLTWRGLVAHRVRLVATVVAVALGVSFVAGTYVLTDTLRAAITSVLNQSQAHVAIVVDGRSVQSTSALAGDGGNLGDLGLTIPQSTIAKVASVPGVAAAEGTAVGAVKVLGPGHKVLTSATSLQLAFSVGDVPALRSLTLRHGKFPTAPSQAVLDVTTARRYHIDIGQTIDVAGAGSTARFHVVGIVGYGSADSLAGATIVGLTLTAAQAVLGQPGRVYDVVASASFGVSSRTLAKRVAAAVGPRFQVQTQAQAIAATTSAVNKGLSVFGDVLLVFAGVALFVAVFLIFNTFSILLTQRTRELALLRCLGALRRQIVLSVLVESGAIGLASSVIGLGAGVLLALGLRSLLAAVGVGFPSTPPVVELRTVVVSLIVGTAATMAAALLPAWRAARTEPVGALRDEPAVDTQRPAPLRVALGLALVVLGVVAVVGALQADGGRSAGASTRADVAGLGLVLGFLGLAALVPMVVRPLAGALGWPLARLLGVPGKLGRSNAMRNPRRTASTAAALMIGLTLVTGIAVLSHSVQSSTDASLEQGLHADLILSPSSTQSLSPSVVARVAAVRQLHDEAALSSGELRIDSNGAARGVSRLAGASGTDVASYVRDVSVPVVAGTLRRLGTNAVAVTTGIAESWHLKVGDELEVGSTQVKRDGYRVAAVIGDPTGMTGDLLFTTSGLAHLFPQSAPSVQRVLVRVVPGTSLAVAERAMSRVLATFPQVKVRTKASFINSQNKQFQQLIGVVTALLGLAVVIALFGIVNTLALSVIERRREIGLLRALGLSRRQLRAAIRWEAVVVALIGTILGIVLGIVFGWVVVDAIRSDGVNLFSVPVVELVLFVVVAALAGVVAALVPARSAARVDVLAAITTE
ncbi:MAG: ABC transporter permease [Actinomycetota bacterium]|nr:ABC transporter permease [Actinomycetota bacterium]